MLMGNEKTAEIRSCKAQPENFPDPGKDLFQIPSSCMERHTKKAAIYQPAMCKKERPPVKAAVQHSILLAAC
jgi:hypothetical protein